MTSSNPVEALLGTIHILMSLIPTLADWITIWYFCSSYLYNPGRIALGYILSLFSKINREAVLIELMLSVDERKSIQIIGRGVRTYLKLTALLKKTPASEKDKPSGLLE